MRHNDISVMYLWVSVFKDQLTCITKHFVMDDIGKLITEHKTIILSLGIAGNIFCDYPQMQLCKSKLA